jgi:CBS domain-containing protein
MQARDIMTANVETVRPDTEVREIVKRLLARNISAMPVVDDQDKVVGIVSEGDLMHRSENETERQQSWWIRMLAEPLDRARDFVKANAQHAKNIMSREVISVTEDTSLVEIAETLEKHHIKRVPVMRDGKLVGIVSRANLLQGLVAAGAKTVVSENDRDLKDAIEGAMNAAGLNAQYVNVVVADGSLTLWGMVETKAEQAALGIAAERVAGVGRVDNHIGVMPALVRTVIGSE